MKFMIETYERIEKNDGKWMTCVTHAPEKAYNTWVECAAATYVH
jgi:hypothetical protein